MLRCAGAGGKVVSPLQVRNASRPICGGSLKIQTLAQRASGPLEARSSAPWQSGAPGRWPPCRPPRES